jgi:hypothetical protein
MNKNIDLHKALEAMNILALACIVFGLIFKLQVFFYAASCLLVIGVFFGRLAIIITAGWLKFAYFLGFINTRIILTLIYYLLLTPIAYIYRLLHGDFLNIKRNTSLKSYFVERNHAYEPKDFENVW